MAKYVIDSLEYHGVTICDLKISRKLKGYNTPLSGYCFIYEPFQCIGFNKHSEYEAIEDLKRDIEAFIFAHSTVGNIEKHLTKCGFKQNEDGSWRCNNK